MGDALSHGNVITSSTQCNYGTHDVTIQGTYNVGLEFGFPFDNQWELTKSVQEEVMSAFSALHSPDWVQASSNVATFQPRTEQSYTVTLKPGTKSSVVQLVGFYGPYHVQSAASVSFITLNC